MAGLTHPHYQRQEAGTENPTAAMLLGLAEALNVPISLILDDTPLAG